MINLVILVPKLLVATVLVAKFFVATVLVAKFLDATFLIAKFLVAKLVGRECRMNSSIVLNDKIIIKNCSQIKLKNFEPINICNTITLHYAVHRTIIDLYTSARTIET